MRDLSKKWGKDMLRMDMKRAFGRWFMLAAVMTLLLLVNGVSYMLFDDDGDAVLSLEFALSMGYAQPLMPLLAALAFGTAFCQDYTNGVCPSVVTRSGLRRYLSSKAALAALAGGASICLGMALFMGLANFRFPPDLSEGRMMAGETALSQLLAEPGLGSYLWYHALMLLMQFMRGAFWSLVALSFSAFYPNLPLTLCAPLILFYAADAMLTLPSVGGAVVAARRAAEMVFDAPLAEALSTALMYLILGALAAMLFGIRAGRRLRYA